MALAFPCSSGHSPRSIVLFSVTALVVGGRGVTGYPSEVRIFAGWRKGAQMSAVRGSGVEGGLRGVPGGRPAKKKKTQPRKKV